MIHILFLPLASIATAQTNQTIDLKPFAGPSPFSLIGEEWRVPRGLQVINGVPFQINGIVFVDTVTKKKQMFMAKGQTARTNLNVAVGRSFDQIHLLAAAREFVANGTVIGRVLLSYADGSSNSIDLRFGHHMRMWEGPRHKPANPLSDTNSRVAWQTQSTHPAESDNALRLFHTVLANPSLEKEVRAISIESTKAPTGIIIAGLSVGPAAAERLPDTIPQPHLLFPDLTPRKGDPSDGAGIINDTNGAPIATARVKILGARNFDASYWDLTTDPQLPNPVFDKEAEVDAEGKFKLPGFPDNKLYRLVVYADGFECRVFSGLDPKADPIEIRLKPLATNKYTAHCRVIGPGGKPVAHALIDSTRVSSSDGGWQGIDRPFIVANSNGEFRVGQDKPFARIYVKINSPGLAPDEEWVERTNALNTIEMDEGSTVTGRILKDDHPLPGLRVGLKFDQQSQEQFEGLYEVLTGKNGAFVFEHVPANKSWTLYGRMASFKHYGALAFHKVSPVAAGQTNDVGDLKVIPAVRLSGRVKSKSNETLPEKIAVNVTYSATEDVAVAKVDSQGNFTFDGLVPGTIQFVLDLEGWRLAGRNRSLGIYYPQQLSGILDKDKTNLLVLIEHKKYQDGQQTFGYIPDEDREDNRPFEGAEPSGTPFTILGGRVLDDNSGLPISSFKIIPGRKPSAGNFAQQKTTIQKALEPFTKKNIPWNEIPYWEQGREETFSNGVFSLEVRTLSSQPMLRVEASGYQAFESEPIPGTTRNLVIRLKSGSGPNGIVLQPDGKPAAKASIIFAAAREQFSMKEHQLSTFWGGERTNVLEITGKDGKFSFQSRAEGNVLFVSHDSGWAQVSVAKDTDNLKVQLKPWAVIRGTLVNPNGSPVAGTSLRLTMFHDWQQGAHPLVNLENTADTDAQGRFEFRDVPPQRLEIQRMIPTGGGGSTYTLQTWLVPQPGITNNIGNVKLDTPPPEPVIDKIKLTLGF